MNTAPLTISIVEATKLTGLGRSSIYRAISEGKIKTKHFGRRTLIEMSSVQAFIAGLPDDQAVA